MNVETTTEANVVTASYGPESDTCLKCGVKGELYKHSPFGQEIRDLPTLGKPTIIQTRRRRYKCKSCGGTFSQPIEGLDDRGTMTKRLVSYIQEEAVQRPFTHVAKATGVTEGTVRNLFEQYIKRLDERIRFVTPKVLGIDELHLLGNYCCVLTNVGEKTLVDILASRTQPVVWNRIMRLEDRKAVEVVTMDMWNPYRAAVKDALPQAAIVVDKFHIVRMANQALETLRKSIRGELDAKARRGLMHDRFVLLKREKDLTEKDMLKLESWTGQYPRLAALYRSKEDFYGIWEAKDEKEARELYEVWKGLLPADQAAAWKDVITAMKNWDAEIFAYFSHRYTNAYTEAFNGLVKVAHRLGRGYSFDAIRAKMLYTHGEFRKPSEGSALRTQEALAKRRTLPVEVLANGSYGKPISTVVERLTRETDSTQVYE